MAAVMALRSRSGLLARGGRTVVIRDDAAGFLDRHIAGAGHPLKGTQSAVVERKVGASGAARSPRPGRGRRRGRRHQRKCDSTILERQSPSSQKVHVGKPVGKTGRSSQFVLYVFAEGGRYSKRNRSEVLQGSALHPQKVSDLLKPLLA